MRTRIAFILSIFFVPIFGLLSSVRAEGVLEFDSYNVNIDVNQDSTMVVTEEINYLLTGTWHALYRDITLEDKELVTQCRENVNLQCGGFEFINVNEVYGDGTKLELAREGDYRSDSAGHVITDANQFAAYTYQGVDKNFLRVQWVFAEDGRQFNKQPVTLKVKYTVYGGIGYFDDYDLFYWNTLPEIRDSIINSADININFPKDTKYSPENFTIPGQNFTVEVTNKNKTLHIHRDLILPYEAFTVLYRFSKGIVDQYATIDLSSSPDQLMLGFGDLAPVGISEGEIKGIPPGQNLLRFSADGYLDQQEEINLLAGENRPLEIKLEPNAMTKIRNTLIVAGNVIGALIMPFGGYYIYKKWKVNGRDVGRRPVVAPEYKAPDNMPPYLLGSLKDELVDLTDITANIIDLAYRGYIKIKEFKSKELLGLKISKPSFELFKQKDFDDLEGADKLIADKVFGTQQRVTTDSLRNKFYLEIPKIQSEIYKEMVAKGYFSKNPDSTRKKYYGIGGGLFSFGILASILNGVVGPFFVTGGVSLVILGIFTLLIARFMPAKTNLGSQALDKILGFKMYLETAEKYRVQNLTPETFEKFLSYAIVFGVEKQWAAKFKDIYKGMPDWYESDNGNFNTIYFANSLRSFDTTATSAMTTSPSSSSSGSGWSGGGGFSGGFSGGGGGGGGAGGW